MSARGATSDVGGSRWIERAWVQVVIVLLVCAGVYWVGLGARPLDFSEGHRAVPGWTMLRTGEWWHQEMFGLTYIRKPPGMAWAIGASAMVFGESAWSARVVSALCATLAALVSLGYSRRWFGARAGLAGGLGQALMPLMWSPARSAEIEMLLMLGAQMAGLGLVGLMARGRERGMLRDLRMGVVDVAVAAVGIVIAALAKGPAAFGVVAGVMLAAWMVGRSPRMAMRAGVLGVCVLAAGVMIPAAMKFMAANSAADAVREQVAEKFLWSSKRVMDVGLLGPLALVSALPISLAVIAVVWRTRGARERRGGDAEGEVSSEALEGRDVARMLALGWVVSVVALMIGGVGNPRYAMPGAMLLGPLWAWWCACVLGASERGWVRGVSSARVWGSALVVGGCAFAIVSLYPTVDQRSGERAAREIARAIEGEVGARAGQVVWCDGVIEDRPDVVWMIERELGRAFAGSDRVPTKARPPRVEWAKREIQNGEMPERGRGVTHLVLRTDAEGDERGKYARALERGTLTAVGNARVRRHEYTVFAVVGGDAGE